MKTICTEKEFSNVINTIQQALKAYPHEGFYDQLIIEKREFRLVNTLTEETRNIGWQSLYEEIDRQGSSDIDAIVDALRSSYSPKNLEVLISKLKELSHG